jgi:hypothetical protein
LSKDTIDFLKKTLAIRDKNRIEWKDVLNHDIFSNFFKTKEYYDEKS